MPQTTGLWATFACLCYCWSITCGQKQGFNVEIAEVKPSVKNKEVSTVASHAAPVCGPLFKPSGFRLCIHSSTSSYVLLVFLRTFDIGVGCLQRASLQANTYANRQRLYHKLSIRRHMWNLSICRMR